MHIHTDFSTGSESMSDIALQAVDRGVDVLVVTDDDLLEVSYGLPLLRQLARVTRTERGLFSEGSLTAYLEEIRRVDEQHDNLIVIDAVESAPFYYWDIDFSGLRWTLRNWNKHMIAVNLGSAEAYRRLPVIGNSEVDLWQWQNLLLLWPLAGIGYALLRGHSGLLRALVAVASVLCLINNSLSLYKVPLFDAYHGDLGALPYQHYIDYVNREGGMAFWPHPEAGSTIPVQSAFGIDAESETEPHAADLVLTSGYTGFAALYADHITATNPGNEWDQVLSEYVRGLRDRPVWGTGEIDYHAEMEGGRIHDILTVFLVRERTGPAVLEALRDGRFYAVRGGDEALELSTFSISCTQRDRVAIAGQELVSESGRVNIAFGVGKVNGEEEAVRIRIVRGGGEGASLVADFTGSTPLEYERVELDLREGERIYYRLMITSPGSILISNPIFVSRGRTG